MCMYSYMNLFISFIYINKTFFINTATLWSRYYYSQLMQTANEQNEKLSYLFEVTQSVRGWAWTQTQGIHRGKLWTCNVLYSFYCRNQGNLHVTNLIVKKDVLESRNVRTWNDFWNLVTLILETQSEWPKARCQACSNRQGGLLSEQYVCVSCGSWPYI